MMEKELTPENEESPEQQLLEGIKRQLLGEKEQQLVRLLKERRIEDSEVVEDSGVKDTLIKWATEQEERVEQSDNYPLAQIEFNLLRAYLYLAAGYVRGTFENLVAARAQARNDHRDGLYRAIMREIDELAESLSDEYREKLYREIIKEMDEIEDPLMYEYMEEFSRVFVEKIER
ncbi:MAG: hypothetical protein CEN88_279 [Candidatus Berkelbacteria bacterium Licking1014_2]|uniref:Uncharacterized protein n=1 Tax=Candidatus Berkelbacteria bacterium Licking1014_2 TaxID=2017146 RepID=A0A554LV60_9BACT|nr:MAG: hypothetical protein CEN88_279 [Candidatus Berkelbacteria bacterium Licking1014_2]